MVHRTALLLSIIAWILATDGLLLNSLNSCSRFLIHLNANAGDGDKRRSHKSPGKNQPSKKEDVPTATTAHELSYEREGHTILRNLVSGIALERLTKAVQSEYDFRAIKAYTAKLRELGVGIDASSQLGVKAALAKTCRDRGMPMPTLQVYNLHRANRLSSKEINKVASSLKLGRAAADLMGVDSVMLYQTAAFYKFSGEGETAWHSDLNTAPFDTNYMVTFWIALTDVSTLQHSPLEFASRSHRDFALPFWYTTKGMRNLDSRGYEIAKFEPMSAGDATAHHGWLLHSAPPNESNLDRKALTISFVATHARRLGVKDVRNEPNDIDRKGYKEVQNDALIGNTHESWILDIVPGEPVKHRDLPVVFTRPGRKSRL